MGAKCWMGLVLLTERHAQQMAGMLTCCDRLLVQGTWPVFSYAEGMTSYLTQQRYGFSIWRSLPNR